MCINYVNKQMIYLRECNCTSGCIWGERERERERERKNICVLMHMHTLVNLCVSFAIVVLVDYGLFIVSEWLCK